MSFNIRLIFVLSSGLFIFFNDVHMPDGFHNGQAHALDLNLVAPVHEGMAPNAESENILGFSCPGVQWKAVS